MSTRTTVLLAAGFFGVTFGAAWALMDFLERKPGPAVAAAPQPPPMKASLPGVSSKVTRDDTAETIETMMEIQGRDYDPALLKAARDDAPSVKTHAKIAIVKSSQQSLLCISKRGETGADHAIVPFTANDMGSIQTGDVLWVAMGCAEAVQKRGELVSLPGLGQKVLQVIPDTPKYARDKQKLVLAMSRGFNEAN